ncbi:hypothetical protein IT408_01840 [Candidatus Uhrbacteria bacterium]|nr:hypothetical protein [Candidatus Uhrbacteria bacterium]
MANNNKKMQSSRAPRGTPFHLVAPFIASLVFVTTACGGGSSDPVAPNGTAGSGNASSGGSSSGTSGMGGSGSNAGTGGVSGSGGDAGVGGSSGTGNNGGTGGSSPCGEAGHGSTSQGNGTNCAGTSGMGGTGNAGAAGDAGTAGAAAGEGGSGTGGLAGSAGEGGSAGAGGSSGSSAGSAGSDAGSAGMGGTGNAGAGGDAGTAGAAAGEGGSAGAGGSSGSSAGSAGSDAGSAGMGGTGNAGTAGTAGSAGSAGAPQNTFTCSSWTRNTALDAANVQEFFLSGGIWGTGANSIYVTLHNQNVSSGVFHWDGTTWTKTVMPGSPPELNGIWGSSDDDIWVAGRNFKGFLYHKSGGTWVDDPNKPVNTKAFKQVWGNSADDVWLLGADSGWNYRIWRRNGGTSWIQQNLPSLELGSVLYRIWGIDGHVFATGSKPSESGGILFHFDGSNWESMTVQGTATELFQISGTSINDLFISGVDNKQGIVYHLTNGLTTWTSFITNDISLYGPILSLKPGTFIASGYLAPAGTGKMRVTTFDMNGAITVPVDNAAYNPTAFWAQPGSNTVWSVGQAGDKAGLYAANCD